MSLQELKDKRYNNDNVDNEDGEIDAGYPEAEEEHVEEPVDDEFAEHDYQHDIHDAQQEDMDVEEDVRQNHALEVAVKSQPEKDVGTNKKAVLEVEKKLADVKIGNKEEAKKSEAQPHIIEEGEYEITKY